MKLIIAGGRDINLAIKAIGQLLKKFNLNPTEIVCGEAAGVDLSGKNYAIEHNIVVVSFPANWKDYGRSAGPIRNKAMADYADALLAVWDGESRGTKNMIDTMRFLNKEVFIWSPKKI